MEIVMKKRVSVVLAASLMTMVLIPTESFALMPVVHPVPIVSGGGGGAGAAGGVIGVAAFFVVYDLIRRTSCSGDFLGLGGPGFSTPITVENVITPPKCGPIPRKRHRAVLRAKG
jgi:hypothetical protein